MGQQDVLVKGDRLIFAERLAKGYVRSPGLACGIMWAIIVMISLFAMNQGWLTPQDIGNRDWLVTDSIEMERYDTVTEGVEEVTSEFLDEVEIAVRSEIMRFTATDILFEWADGRDANIMTAANVQKLCNFQKTFLTAPSYKKFCKTDFANGSDTVCSSIPSTNLVSAFYPTFEDQLACELIADIDFSQKYTDLFANVVASNSAYFVDQKFLQTDVITKSRSTISFAGPLGIDSTGKEKFTGLVDQPGSKDAQNAYYTSFLNEELQDRVLEANNMKGSFFSSAYNIDGIDLGDGVMVRFQNFYWQNDQFLVLVNADMLLASAAAILVGAIVFWHVGSLFVTLNAVFSIVFSLPVSAFFYTGILGIEYFAQIHIVTLYVVLGIGADNLFVIFDAYKNTKTTWKHLRGFQSIQDAEKANVYGTGDGNKEMQIARLAFAWRRASVAIFNTSFTTFVAFMATGVSPVTPVASFGFFAAIAIVINFTFALLLFPSVIILSENNFMDRGVICCPCVREPTNFAVERKQARIEALDNSSDDEADQAALKESCESKVFTKLYLPMVMKKTKISGHDVYPVALFFLVLFAGLGLTSMNFAVKLSTPTEDDESFTDRHMFTGLSTDLNTFLGGNSDAFAQMTVAFGFKGIDRSDFNRFVPSENIGTVIWDDDFDILPRANQEYMLDLCDQLAALSCVPQGATQKLPGCLGIGNELVREVGCLIRDFHEWNDARFNETAIDLGESDSALFYERLRNFSVAEKQQQAVGFDTSGKLKYFLMGYTLTLKFFQPEQIKGPVLELVEDWYDEAVKTAPQGLETWFQTGFDFAWIVTERGIVSGMFSGLAISLPTAFVVVLLSTANALIAFFSLLTIVSIVSFVLSVAYFMGWALGIGEAIASIMVVGLSVDYTIHLGKTLSHAHEEGHTSREDRFRYTVEHMGPTVFAATITTAVSSAVMFGCQMSFFSKMATLIVSTIVASFFFSFFFFMPLCLTFSTENPFFCVLSKRGCGKGPKSSVSDEKALVTSADDAQV